MGKCLLVCIVLFLNIHRLYAQDDFEKYIREQEIAFEKYAAKEDAAFKAYNDSINKAFGRYLAEAWPDCPLIKSELICFPSPVKQTSSLAPSMIG